MPDKHQQAAAQRRDVLGNVLKLDVGSSDSHSLRDRFEVRASCLLACTLKANLSTLGVILLTGTRCSFPGPVCSVQGELFIDVLFCRPSTLSHKFQLGSFAFTLADGEPRANLAASPAGAICQRHLDL
jgi:hypothetical protein